jgi:hypothetical protein
MDKIDELDSEKTEMMMLTFLMDQENPDLGFKYL